MAFEQWQSQLYNLLAAVQLKQRQYDQAINACEVLLKPWPKKLKDSEAAVKVGASDNSKNERQVDPHEEAELKVVDDLLRKAQKARVKTTSRKQMENVYPIDDEVASARSQKELWEVCDVEFQNPQTSFPDGNTQSSNYKQISVTQASDSKENSHGACSQTSAKIANRKQQQKALAARESGRQNFHRGPDPHNKCQSSVSGVIKPTVNADLKKPKSREGAGSSQSHSRPRSGHGKVKPAHVTAPFKTDPNLHAVKRSAKIGVRPVKQQPPGKHQNYAGDRNYTNKVLPPISSEKDQSSVLASNVGEDDSLQDVCNTYSARSNADAQPMVDIEGSSSHEETLSNKLSSVTLDTDQAQDVASAACGVSVVASHPEDTSTSSGEKQETKLFSLLSDGSSINIPPKVRRAFAKNQQLRKKVSQQRERKLRTESVNTGQKFADKLQQLFDPEEELLYRQQALECLHAHQQLLHVLTQLNLEHLTEAASAKDILRAKLLAEFVLSSFSGYSEDVNIFSKVQFPEIPVMAQPSCLSPKQLYQWLPSSLQRENHCATQKLEYSSKTDLRHYFSTLLQVQTLQCQHHLLNILVSNVLPWLQKFDSHHEEFGALFRGLFALLTSSGTTTPVLIHSSVE